MSSLQKTIALFIACLLGSPGVGYTSPREDSIHIAVAANFRPTIELLLETFTRQHGTAVSVSSASTGALYAQILAGAPYAMFFAADSESTKRLADSGHGDRKTRRHYALGKLALVYRLDREKGSTEGHKESATLADWASALCTGTTRHREHGTAKESVLVAIAKPRHAPYGRAAQQALHNAFTAQGRNHYQLVSGNNVMQALQFFVQGHVEAAIVSRSLITKDRLHSLGISEDKSIAQCEVDPVLYDSVEQSMIVLNDSNDSLQERQAGHTTRETALYELYHFFFSSEARRIIEDHGYALP